MRKIDYAGIGYPVSSKKASTRTIAPADELLTLAQVAADLKICVKTLRSLIRKHGIPVVRVGRQFRLRANHVKHLLIVE